MSSFYQPGVDERRFDHRRPDLYTFDLCNFEVAPLAPPERPKEE